MLYRMLAAVVLVPVRDRLFGVKDEPLPLSRENIEKYAAAVGKVPETRTECRQVVERVDTQPGPSRGNTSGYSFDRTLRHYFVHRAESRGTLNPGPSPT
jgi:hypothetical protein